MKFVKKYLILVPIIFLVLSAVYFRYVTDEIPKILLQEKYIGIVDEVDLIAAGIETNSDYDIEQHVINQVHFLDGLFQVYAAAYNSELVLITSRNFETTVFDPLDYTEFTAAIQTQDSGNLVIGYTPENQDYRELHIYFRWANQFLIVAGVSSHSVVTMIPALVSVGVWVNMALTFIFNLCMVIAITRKKGGENDV